MEIHGQHDDRALVRGEEHRRLLDAFGRLEDDADDVAARYRDLRNLQDQSARQRAALDAASREADYLRASVEELEALAPEAGEETVLAERRHFLMRAEKVAVDLEEAQLLVGGNASPVPELAALARRLERKSVEMPGFLDPVVGALNAALDRLEDARSGLAAAIRECAFDPGELERVEERLFALRAAGRKFQVPVDDLTGTAAEFAAQLAELDLGSERLKALEQAAAAALDAYRRAAERFPAAARRPRMPWRRR